MITTSTEELLLLSERDLHCTETELDDGDEEEEKKKIKYCNKQARGEGD